MHALHLGSWARAQEAELLLGVIKAALHLCAGILGTSGVELRADGQPLQLFAHALNVAGIRQPLRECCHVGPSLVDGCTKAVGFLAVILHLEFKLGMALGVDGSL